MDPYCALRTLLPGAPAAADIFFDRARPARWRHGATGDGAGPRRRRVAARRGPPRAPDTDHRAPSVLRRAAREWQDSVLVSC